MDEDYIKADTDVRPLRLDVGQVLRTRMPRHYRYIPGALIHWLERTICQDEMNRFLATCPGTEGADFCRALIEYLDAEVVFHGADNLPPPDERRVLWVSNHPLGGLDGVALIDFATRYYGCPCKFVVNDILSAIKPLESVFLPVNKHGAQSRNAVRALDEAFTSDTPLLMFPAGLVSRRGPKGVIRDLEWQKMFVTKARQSRRTVIPVHFCAENSPFFYKFAKFRKRLGLKFNIEMIYLPREVFRGRGRRFDVNIGKPLPASILQGNPSEAAQKIKEIVYSL